MTEKAQSMFSSLSTGKSDVMGPTSMGKHSQRFSKVCASIIKNWTAYASKDHTKLPFYTKNKHNMQYTYKI